MSAKILIVEDDPIILMSQQEIVSSLGYEVMATARSGEVAIELARQHTPDLILMDVKLPGMIDGREAANRIRQTDNVPVIFVTAYGYTGQAAEGNIEGEDGIGYVIKPYTAQALDTEIRRLLHKTARQRPGQPARARQPRPCN